MRNKKVSENAFVLIFNGILLFVQCFVFMEKIDVLAIVLLIYIPILIACLIVFMIIYHMNGKYNDLVANGTIINASINHELTKVVFALKGLFIIKITCSFFDDVCTHVFEEQYPCDMYRYRKVKSLIDQTNSIDVLVSDDYNNYHIFVSSIEGNTYKDDYFFVPAQFNYMIGVVNIIVFFINVVYVMVV